MSVQTSKISVTNISVPQGASQVRKKSKRTYTATQLTGPITDGSDVEYKTEIIRYDNAKGDNPVTIGERNNSTGKIDWNSNASKYEVKNGNRLGKTSANQINDVIRDFIGPLSAAERIGFNKAAGNRNKALGSGIRTPRPAPDRPTQAKAGTRRSFNQRGPLVYPITLRQSQQDYIKFEMLEYQAKGFGLSTGNISGVGDKRNANRRGIGTVVLPIPGGISDTNAVQWGEENMNPMDAALANTAYSAISAGTKGVQAVMRGANEGLEGAGPELKRAVASAFAGAAAGVGGQLLTRATGEILNPNMELLFKGPSLRPFNFSFKLAPRSSKEAETVIAILRFFKQGMAPIKSKSNLFLKSPYTFRLGYFHRNTEHKALNKFKECALQNVTVEYTPDGNYATYEDGVMTAYQMTMQFQELEPVFNDDSDSGFDSVGY